MGVCGGGGGGGGGGVGGGGGGRGGLGGKDTSAVEKDSDYYLIHTHSHTQYIFNALFTLSLHDQSSYACDCGTNNKHLAATKQASIDYNVCTAICTSY